MVLTGFAGGSLHHTYRNRVNKVSRNDADPFFVGHIKNLVSHAFYIITFFEGESQTATNPQAVQACLAPLLICVLT